ncbi:GntR family transcriptional regulator [Pelomonas sp. KK5]|uniref:GntR family transcriptional regulator n=1 Tax=Pelomonas sp. KK5 TaxID=1855730 RepID=UPI00097C467A|nr:GntR family transcriptional regulator [Pelomonas sp. KK5]
MTVEQEDRTLPPASGRATKLVDEVARVLRQRIYGGVYPPGELLRQVQLSQDLNVSRTPLREALRLLQSEGLVAAEGARGVCVTRADRSRLLNAYSMREMLDGLAARQAAEKAADRARAVLEPMIERQVATLEPWSPVDYVRHNVDFHTAIIEMADNEFLSAQTAVVRLTSTVFAPAVLVTSARARPAIGEHRLVVEAIAAGNGAEAERLARHHIRETIECLKKDRCAE